VITNILTLFSSNFKLIIELCMDIEQQNELIISLTHPATL